MSLMSPEGPHTHPSVWTRESLETFILGRGVEDHQGASLENVLSTLPREDLVTWVLSLMRQEGE